MMPDDLDLMQLASTGQKLAREGDTDYLAVHVVLAWAADGTPTMYCAYRDWAATPIARLAAKDQELEAQLAARTNERPLPEAPAQNQAAMLAQQAAYIGVEPSAPPDPIICPDCGAGDWRSPKALQMHRQRAHQGMVAVRTPAAPLQFVEELGWRCAAKGCSGAHARDLHDPAFCTLHATSHTNGQLTHA